MDIKTKKSAGWAITAAMLMAIFARPGGTAPLPGVEDPPPGPSVPSAASMIRFYPLPLASSPLGTVEDSEVWLAKLQGLIANAPLLLQQTLLMSQSKQEFAASVALLQQMQKGLLEQDVLNLHGEAMIRRTTTKALGDKSNSVYNALSPCRIMDTRSATPASGVQGPIAGGSLKQIPGFIAAGSDWSQYGQTGTLSDCGLNNSVGPNISAIALVITILNPNFDAYLGVSDSSTLATVLSSVALNYTHGQGLSTMYILPQKLSNTVYFALPAGLSAHLIFDVVGYFARSDATAMDCVWTAQSTVNLAAGTASAVSSSACDAGYAMTGGTCYLSTGDATLVDSGSGTFFNPNVWYCYGRAGALASSITSFGRCCRVPGK